MSEVKSYQVLKLICVSSLILLNVHVAQSQPDSAKTYKFYLNAGAYFPETETKFQANSNHGVGTLIFIEHLLNTTSHPFVFSANAYWKITKRSSLSARYFHYQVKGTVESSDSQITIRDTVINLGAELDSKWTNNYFGLTYNFSVFAKPTWNAGLSAGLRSTVFNFNLDYKLPN